MTDLKTMLYALTEAPGVSGDEGEILHTAKQYLAPYGAVSTDAIGNLICEVPGTNRHILLDAHMDQIGFVVLEITPEGFLRVAPCGGADKRVLAAAEVTVFGKTPLYGVVTSTPPHLQGGEDNQKAAESIFVDIGLSAEQARAQVSAGDRVALRHSFATLCGDVVSAPALDDRAGLAVLLRTLEKLRDGGCKDHLTVVFSTREETTEGGAQAAAFRARADLCLAVDVSFAKTPDAKAEECGVLGAGVMIGFAPSLTREVSVQLRTVAETHGIAHQIEVMGASSGTNADVMAAQAGGAQTGLLSIPLRYMHTGIETISLADVESTAELLAAFILEGGTTAC